MFKLAFLVLLVVSVSLKVQQLRGTADERAYPLAEGKTRVADFLRSKGFQLTAGAEDADTPFVQASLDACRVVAMAASPLGWDKDILPRLARRGDEAFFVLEGVRFTEQPVWRTRTGFYWRKLRAYSGLGGSPSTVLGVLTSPQCGAQRAALSDFDSPSTAVVGPAERASCMTSPEGCRQ